MLVEEGEASCAGVVWGECVCSVWRVCAGLDSLRWLFFEARGGGWWILVGDASLL